MGIICQVNFKLHFTSLVLVSGRSRVSIQGVKSLGGHFACLCRGIDFYEVKKKENGNTFTLLIIVFEKSLQKEQKAQITQYDP